MAKRASRLYATMRWRKTWFSLVIAGTLLVVAFRYKEMIALANAIAGLWDGLSSSQQGLLALLIALIGLPASYLGLVKQKSGSAGRSVAVHRPTSFPFGVYNTKQLD